MSGSSRRHPINPVPNPDLASIDLDQQRLDLATATAIVLFGFDSGPGAALATVVGVLVEVPVMLSVVKITMATKGWYERAA
jgi:ACR3 family arsenite efflux pump ArsB